LMGQTLTEWTQESAVPLKSLSGEICLTSDRLKTSEALVNKCLGSLECIAQRERIRYKPIALCWVTGVVIKQKSADGIVAKRPS